MLKTSHIFFLGIALLFMVVSIVFSYSYVFQDTKEEFIHSSYEKQAVSLETDLRTLLNIKQKATLGLAITIAKEDKNLSHYINNRNIPNNYFKALIHDYKKYTLYKNIWIQLIDRNGFSCYRSWSDANATNLGLLRDDVSRAIRLKEPMTSVSVGQFDISLKSIAPIFKNGNFVGLVEVISHFNSLAKVLKRMNVESVVLADAHFKSKITNAWKKSFIDSYYISNLDAKKELVDYLQQHGVNNYTRDGYKVENDYLIISYPIMDGKKHIGTYIMFKKLADITFLDIDKFIYKWLIFGIILFVIILLVVDFTIYYIFREQKKYYKSIIDTSGNIVLTNDSEKIIDTNKVFFRYFNKYKTLAEFLKKHECICDFFIEEEGYLHKYMHGQSWVNYLLSHQQQNNKIKMNIDGVTYYFLASASKISQSPLRIAIILADITEQEIYKHELEEQTMTDALTGVKNRRFYESRMQYEVSLACRYEQKLSIIMFDIDHFKQVNDKYGHDIGDKVLVEYTEIIASMLRKTDLLCRIGGEEFVIIAPQTSKDDAYKLAEKIRHKVEESKHIVPLTMSFGVTEYIDCEDKDSLFKRADQALYDAKKTGRNRVVVA